MCVPNTPKLLEIRHKKQDTACLPDRQGHKKNAYKTEKITSILAQYQMGAYLVCSSMRILSNPLNLNIIITSFIHHSCHRLRITVSCGLLTL